MDFRKPDRSEPTEGSFDKYYGTENINVEGKLPEPKTVKKDKALSMLDQLAQTKETPLAEPMPLSPELPPIMNTPERSPASTGGGGGVPDELLIAGAGMLGSLLGGGRAAEGAGAGAQGIKDLYASREREQARKDKLAMYLDKKKSTSTKYQKATYKDKDGKSRMGKFNPSTGEVTRSANDPIVPSRMSDEEYAGRRNLTYDLGRKGKDIDYVRGMADKLRTRLKGISETNLKAEKAFELLGSGQLQDKAAVMTIVKELEGRMTDADRAYYSSEISMLNRLGALIDEQSGNTLNPRLKEEAEMILRNSIMKNNEYIEKNIADAERNIRAEGIQGDVRSRLPNIKAAKLNDTIWVTSPEGEKVRLRKTKNGWETYGD